MVPEFSLGSLRTIAQKDEGPMRRAKGTQAADIRLCVNLVVPWRGSGPGNGRPRARRRCLRSRRWSPSRREVASLADVRP